VSLPEGHDPDDLVRAGGRGAVEEIISVARPLAHVLWTRDRGGGPDTPEAPRRLRARLAALINAIGDDGVRK
jgi:DNA primase